MDGVLADTGAIHFESWVKMVSEIGKNCTISFFNETFGQTSTEIVRKIVGSDVDQDTVVNLANLKEKYYREMIKDKLKPLPGVLNLIKELKENKFRLAVGSSGPRENVELLVKSLKIKHYFDCIITAEDVKLGKPNPDVFLTAANRLNVNPKNCIVIEDAPVGIVAAKRAGMKSIAITTTHNRRELIGADLVIKDLSEINIAILYKLLEKTLLHSDDKG